MDKSANAPTTRAYPNRITDTEILLGSFVALRDQRGTAEVRAMNKFVINRELKMIERKKEAATLKESLVSETTKPSSRNKKSATMK